MSAMPPSVVVDMTSVGHVGVSNAVSVVVDMTSVGRGCQQCRRLS